MSSDIVERLGGISGCDCLQCLAATEIERLRAEIADLQKDNDIYDFIVKETTTLRIAPPTNFGELMKLLAVFLPGATVEEDNIGQLVIYTDLKLAYAPGDVADAPLVPFEEG